MNEIRPVAIYNTDKKELMGVFAMATMAARYLYESQEAVNKKQAVYYALENKTRLLNTIFDFPVAVRYANTFQTEMLADENCKIMEGYPAANAAKIRGFATAKTKSI